MINLIRRVINLISFVFGLWLWFIPDSAGLRVGLDFATGNVKVVGVAEE